MRIPRTPLARWLLAALLALACHVSARAQPSATGSLAGRVSHPATGEYLELARITVEGTALETFTDADGQYRLANVPAGAVRVRAFRTGVVAQTLSATVVGGQTATLNFSLEGFSGKPGPAGAPSLQLRVLDTVMGPNGGAFQWIYNVQPPGGRPEFANGSKYDYHFSGEWTLAEWHVDFATQSYTLYINGMEIPGASMSKGAGKFDQAEIPELFESLSFGWNNYQKAEPGGFVAWIDDIALSKERIGDRGLPPPPKKPRK